MQWVRYMGPVIFWPSVWLKRVDLPTKVTWDPTSVENHEETTNWCRNSLYETCFPACKDQFFQHQIPPKSWRFVTLNPPNRGTPNRSERTMHLGWRVCPWFFSFKYIQITLQLEINISLALSWSWSSGKWIKACKEDLMLVGDAHLPTRSI